MTAIISDTLNFSPAGDLLQNYLFYCTFEIECFEPHLSQCRLLCHDISYFNQKAYGVLFLMKNPNPVEIRTLIGLLLSFSRSY